MANYQHQPQSDHNPHLLGSGWLVNTIQRLVVQFKPELNSESTDWVSIRTYHYVPPKPPEPLSHRLVLDQYAIDTWNVIVKRGWNPCRAPAR